MDHNAVGGAGVSGGHGPEMVNQMCVTIHHAVLQKAAGHPSPAAWSMCRGTLPKTSHAGPHRGVPVCEKSMPPRTHATTVHCTFLASTANTCHRHLMTTRRTSSGFGMPSFSSVTTCRGLVTPCLASVTAWPSRCLISCENPTRASSREMVWLRCRSSPWRSKRSSGSDWMMNCAKWNVMDGEHRGAVLKWHECMVLKWHECMVLKRH